MGAGRCAPDVVGVLSLSASHSPQQEVQNIFKAKHPMDTEITKAKVNAVLKAVLSQGPAWGCQEGHLCPIPSVPTRLFALHRLLGLVLRSLKKLILILQILWELVSYIPEPPRSDAYCVWSQIYKPRSGLLRKWLNTLKLVFV